jgi:aerobic-type carbon monoxide dehydrogenase small subunit (CoxS/CutS family)
MEGASIETVESLTPADGSLHPIQAAFRERHALQCGFCTPGFLMAVKDFLREPPPADLTDDDIREAISGNLCRCTGYTNIVDAVRLAADTLYGTER